MKVHFQVGSTKSESKGKFGTDAQQVCMWLFSNLLIEPITMFVYENFQVEKIPALITIVFYINVLTSHSSKIYV